VAKRAAGRDPVREIHDQNQHHARVAQGKAVHRIGTGQCAGRDGNLIDQGGTLPEPTDTLRYDLRAALDAPLNRSTIEDARPAITNLIIRDLRGTWGELELRAKGDMEVRDAQPQGEVAITARNWREMINLAVRSGALNADFASTVELGLGLLASTSGNANALDATLSFSGGRSFIGPIPVGPSPEIRLP